MEMGGAPHAWRGVKQISTVAVAPQLSGGRCPCDLNEGCVGRPGRSVDGWCLGLCHGGFGGWVGGFERQWRAIRVWCDPGGGRWRLGPHVSASHECDGSGGFGRRSNDP